MASWSFIFGIMGNVISILMFASPIKTFKQIVTKKSTENFKGIPYITTLLSTSLWTFYGILKPGGLLVATVNGAGVTMHIVYVVLFLVYAPRPVKIFSLKLVMALDVGFFGAVVVVTMLAIHGATRLTVSGLLCAGLTIGMYAAPLSVMRTVIKTKSVKYMPFFLSLFQFLNGAVWSTYAVLVRDYFIGVPNAIGFLLGSAQLILYMIYRSRSTPEEKMHKEGSAQLVGSTIQMHTDQNEKKNTKHQTSLGKANSLPKPSMETEQDRSTETEQDRSNTLIKMPSLRRYESQKFDIEKGLN